MAVIHSRPDILSQLLSLVVSDVRLQSSLDEQNCLYQVCVCTMYMYVTACVYMYMYMYIHVL